jgi:hypothetical protein
MVSGGLAFTPAPCAVTVVTTHMLAQVVRQSLDNERMMDDLEKGFSVIVVGSTDVNALLHSTPLRELSLCTR